MTENKNSNSGFLGTFFNRDEVISITRIASLFAWIILVIYTVTFVISLVQFSIQFSSGLYFQKGMSPLDLFANIVPLLQQPLPGVLYFFCLKFFQHGLLILLDIEDNSRRMSRSK